MVDPDVGLMLKLREGDVGAFDALLSRHRDWIVNMLWKMVGNRDDAEDLAQEVFLRIYRARKRYRPQAGFRTWARRIAVNLALNHRRKRRPVSLAQFYNPSSALGPDGRAIQAESVQRIWDALHQLPARQRAALVLTRLEGASYREAAQAMGVSMDAVRALIARARDTLKDRLNMEGSEGKD